LDPVQQVLQAAKRMGKLAEKEVRFRIDVEAEMKTARKGVVPS